MKGPTVSPWNVVSPEEMAASFDGCLDIETTGLSCDHAGITVIAGRGGQVFIFGLCGNPGTPY